MKQVFFDETSDLAGRYDPSSVSVPFLRPVVHCEESNTISTGRGIPRENTKEDVPDYRSSRLQTKSMILYERFLSFGSQTVRMRRQSLGQSHGCSRLYSVDSSDVNLFVAVNIFDKLRDSRGGRGIIIHFHRNIGDECTACCTIMVMLVEEVRESAGKAEVRYVWGAGHVSGYHKI